MAKIIPIGGTTCSECDGKGEIELFLGYCRHIETFKCPTCDGEGYVFEEVEWNSDERFD